MPDHRRTGWPRCAWCGRDLNLERSAIALTLWTPDRPTVGWCGSAHDCFEADPIRSSITNSRDAKLVQEGIFMVMDRGPDRVVYPGGGGCA